MSPGHGVCVAPCRHGVLIARLGWDVRTALHRRRGVVTVSIQWHQARGRMRAARWGSSGVTRWRDRRSAATPPPRVPGPGLGVAR